jgi:hypothetical protein
MEQKLVEYIKSATQSRMEYIDRNRSNDPEPRKQLVREWEAVFLSTAPLTESLIDRSRLTSSYEVTDYIGNMLNQHLNNRNNVPYPWTVGHPIIEKIIQSQYAQSNDSFSQIIKSYVARSLTEDTTVDGPRFIAFLRDQKFTDEQIVSIVCAYSSNPFFMGFNDAQKTNRRNTHSRDRENIPTKFGEYLIPLLPEKKGFLGIGKAAGVKNLVNDMMFAKGGYDNKKFYWLVFLDTYYPEAIDDYEKFFWSFDYNNSKTLNMPVLYFLVERDAAVFEQRIIKALDEGNAKTEHRYSILLRLNQLLAGKYASELEQIGENHFSYFHSQTAKDHYYHDPYTAGAPLSQAYSEYLWQQNEANARERITKFVQASTFLPPNYFTYLDSKMGEQSLSLLVEALFKDPDKRPANGRDYYEVIFKIVDKYNVSSFLDKILEFAVKHADKKSRLIASKTLGKYAENILAKVTDLLTQKTVDQRVTGALILSSIGTEAVLAILNEAVDKETNDDTRDIMLESLADKRFGHAYTLEEVKAMIARADERKKLSKWNEKFLEEDKLPKLYWKDTQPLDQKEIRFLLYRMKRAQGLNSDAEAKQMINLFDPEKSQAFAKAMMTAFQESNADSKLKYYLTLAGLLGSDEIMHGLNSLFKKSVADKRVKMAEYVIGALAMVGSDKALRIVEVIYRKFANKKPALSKAAQDALIAAATELSITMDELADRIIPNFDFDGLYKKFTVDGEEYRAFINAEFKLNYFTEDNKVRKSLPTAASKELKTEFKEIEKEVNDVIRSQSGRLEKYMLEDRRWPVEQWRTFFFENPIMFVYALKLVWGVYDERNNLVRSFYCSEDTSLYNVEDQEVELEDGQQVGILHPIHLTAENLNVWRDKLYNMSMVTIFPIMERPIFRVEENERDQNFSKRFFSQEVPKGADFVNTFLVKQNWIKSSGDGGRSEFTKHFKDGYLKAYANIDGPTAWYQGGNAPAKVFDISFMGKNWTDKICLKDLPPIFYSEVMADIDQLIKAS